MTDREKLEKIKALADKMYSRMAYLTSDTRPIRQAMDEYHQFIINEYHKEEPVSEDLEKEIDRAHRIFYDEVGWDSDEGARAYVADWFAHYFANWQKHHMEANRLAHCNSITNEQAELEQKFLDEHLDKYNRMPTFLDAIEYGMRLQKEQMMKNAVDGICISNGAECGSSIESSAGMLFLQHNTFDVGDKVKILIVKSE